MKVRYEDFYWTTAEGEKILISELETEHMNNIVNRFDGIVSYSTQVIINNIKLRLMGAKKASRTIFRGKKLKYEF